MPRRRRKIDWPSGPIRSGLVAACLLLAPAAVVVGCRSPEDGRPRGGGPGGDGGNYRNKPVHVPSKLDGTKQVSNPYGLH
jgi:hypothetical protein